MLALASLIVHVKTFLLYEGHVRVRDSTKHLHGVVVQMRMPCSAGRPLAQPIVELREQLLRCITPLVWLRDCSLEEAEPEPLREADGPGHSLGAQDLQDSQDLAVDLMNKAIVL